VHALWGVQPIRIGAQARLKAYYSQHGFVDVGMPYVEDGIDHQEMVLVWTSLNLILKLWSFIRMITDFKNKTAVLTGAGSGFGLECARIGAKLGMNLVLADVQQDALDRHRGRDASSWAPRCWPCGWTCPRPTRCRPWPRRAFAALWRAALCVQQRRCRCRRPDLGKHLKDWEWVLGVNLMGVVHGVRVFTPMMLAAAKADPATRATSSTPPAWRAC
jgi:hypothetical protein